MEKYSQCLSDSDWHAANIIQDICAAGIHAAVLCFAAKKNRTTLRGLPGFVWELIQQSLLRLFSAQRYQCAVIWCRVIETSDCAASTLSAHHHVCC